MPDRPKGRVFRLDLTTDEVLAVSLGLGVAGVLMGDDPPKVSDAAVVELKALPDSKKVAFNGVVDRLLLLIGTIPDAEQEAHEAQ